MSGTITALAVQKNNKERVNVFLDDQYAFAVTLNVALTLKKGQFLHPEEISRLQYDDQVNKAYQRALHYLSFRPRTRQEVQQNLQEKEYDAEIIELALERLEEHNYIDDAEFGRLWVENRAIHNPKGRKALAYELRQKGLKRIEIDQALEALDETSLAWQAIQKKVRQWRTLDKSALRQKLQGYLARRGFSYNTIEITFEQLLDEFEDR
ncbi:MAG: RecX family transcriptional regulator [Chloroflexota bacterium]